MNLEEVGFCGLHCGLCAARRRIPQQAAELRDTLRKEGYDRGWFDIPGMEGVFAVFWEGLNTLADVPCRSCRNGGGDPACAIRDCARQRGTIACPLCADFPCGRLETLSRYPLFLADGKRMQHVGIEQWAAEQESRAAVGFSYTDVRFPSE